MKMYAKELATKLATDYWDWLNEKDLELENPVPRIDDLDYYDTDRLLTVEKMAVRTCVDYEQKSIGIIDYGIEITVEYVLDGRSFTTKTQTKTMFTDEIFCELLNNLQDEIDRIFLPAGEIEE